VYGNYSNKVKKTFSRFRQMAYGGCFRHDGNLIAAGSEEGVVKVGVKLGLNGVWLSRVGLNLTLMFVGV